MAHGSSDAKAFKNAIRQAIAFSEAELTSDMEPSLAALAARKHAEREKEESNEGN